MTEQLWREWNPDRDNPDAEDTDGVVRYDTPGGQRISVLVKRVASSALLIEDGEVAAVERMVAVELDPVLGGLTHAEAARLLRAAVGEGDR